MKLSYLKFYSNENSHLYFSYGNLSAYTYIINIWKYKCRKYLLKALLFDYNVKKNKSIDFIFIEFEEWINIIILLYIYVYLLYISVI